MKGLNNAIHLQQSIFSVVVDVSMSIDSTGYQLQGKNLTGGPIEFTEKGTTITSLLAREMGVLCLTKISDKKGKTLIQTSVRYNVIKVINLNGINNFIY